MTPENEFKYKQVINDKLTEEEIQDYIQIVKDFQGMRNTIFEHDFLYYIILFQEEASTLTKSQLDSIRDKFAQRFDLFHPIKVVDLSGKIIIEIPAILRSPDTLNGISESLMQNYFNAVQLSDPLRRYDIQAANEMIAGIMTVTNMDDIKKYVKTKVDLEKKYFLKEGEIKKEAEKVEDADRIKISTKGMF